MDMEMMDVDRVREPTQGELELLRVLWRRGPSTVREVRESLEGRERPGYTTVLKLLQIMHQKGLVERDESQRSHVYSPRIGEEETQRRMVSDLVRRAFDGSAAQLVMRALSDDAATADELTEIRRYLGEIESKGDRR